MGTFVFKWPHPEAKEVFVTGSFDDWGKTEQLNKVGDTFEKEVTLKDASQDILYKFVVDGTWTTDHTAPQEGDGHNNVNNILRPDNIKKSSGAGLAAGAAGGVAATGIGAALISGVGAQSTTAQLAGNVPKESSAPGAFPETPAKEPESFSVNPIPASEGAGNPVSVPAGEKLEGVTGNSTSKVTTSKEAYEKGAPEYPEQSFGVNPIAATDGTSNPVSVPAGEKLPLLDGAAGSKVTTSKEDYEKGAPEFANKSFGVDPIPASEGIGNPVSIPAGEPIEKGNSADIEKNVTTSKEDYEKAGSAALPVGLSKSGDKDASAFDLPPVSKNMIPESSLPISGEGDGVSPFLQSSGPGTTTAALAGQVPLEPRAGKVKDAGVSPFIQSSGAGTTTAALAGKVPLEPKAGKKESASPFVQSSGPGTTTAALAGQVPLEPKQDRSEDKGVSPLVQSAGAGTTTAALAGAVPLEKNKASEDKAGPFIQSSGADTTTAALAGKVPLEKEKSGAKPFIQSSGAGTTTAALAGQVPKETTTPAQDVPEVVKESIADAHKSPEAAASPEAVAEKKAVESELLTEVKTSEAVGEPAPTLAAATSATAPAATTSAATEAPPVPEKTDPKAAATTDDVSPIEQTSEPKATDKGKAVEVETPKKTDDVSAAASPKSPGTNSTTDKKSKRRSIFGKVKEFLKK